SMNRPENPSTLMSIPDTQSGSDERHLAIDQVGIRGLRYPLAFADGDLPAQLDELCARLDAPGGRLDVSFPWFVRKHAPVSGVASLLDYEVRLTGERRGGRTTTTLTVAV